MDIYNFLRSYDIADYCKNIGHIFNPIEIACLIEQSDRPIYEKKYVLSGIDRLLSEYAVS